MNLKLMIKVILASLLMALPSFAQIQAGQAIQITIKGVPPAEQARIDGTYPVSQNGTINVPYLSSPVRAAGMRADQLAAVIQNAYKSQQIYRNPTIQVIDTAVGGNIDNQVIHVGGDVRKPGPVPFTLGFTIYQAVQAAGGATEFGSMRRVKLFRNGRQQYYDLTQAQFMNIPLQPNDTIEVPRKTILGR